TPRGSASSPPRTAAPTCSCTIRPLHPRASAPCRKASGSATKSRKDRRGPRPPAYSPPPERATIADLEGPAARGLFHARVVAGRPGTSGPASTESVDCVQRTAMIAREVSVRSRCAVGPQWPERTAVQPSEHHQQPQVDRPPGPSTRQEDMEQEDSAYQWSQDGDAKRRGTPDQQKHAADQAGCGNQGIHHATCGEGVRDRLGQGRLRWRNPGLADELVHKPGRADIRVEQTVQPS